jgi:amino acid adenylation domain-containing protein
MVGDTARGACLHELVEQQVVRSPDAVAVRDGDTDLTYRELNVRANRLARRLQDAGVGVEARVAVALPRSPQLVVAFLAVLKAGAAYVPLDLDYPAERRAFMLADADVSVVVTSAGRREDVAGAGVQVLELDGMDDGPAQDDGDLRVDVHPGNSAYLIYTSGSTGVPKGALIEHGSVVSLVMDDPRLAVAPGDTVAQFAPAAFDASTFEIWSPLCRGGRIAIIPSSELSMERFGAELRRWQPEWLFLTTGFFHLLVDHDLDALCAVGCLMTGGDVLSPQHVRRAADVPGLRLYAAYGPTETTVYASFHLASPDEAPDRVPIGSPLAGKPMFVLDEHLEPVPDGQIGEIYIGGQGLARGYHRRPAITAERFVPDPFSERPGARLYRTGDLGRRLPDGELEFWGRVDRQVKVRGFRVELGEIEAVLSAHDAVGAAAVLAIEQADGGKRLAAYAAPVPGSDPTVSELRAWLGSRLPGYMVPATYVVLDQLPLDPNGKVDRRALPYPWSARDDLGLGPYEAPSSELERLMAGLWAEALELDRVGVLDNFFQLGGDSLRSVEVLERLRAHRIELTAPQFFEHPTIRGATALLEQRGAAQVLT